MFTFLSITYIFVKVVPAMHRLVKLIKKIQNTVSKSQSLE